jgi:hypothetical protein
MFAGELLRRPGCKSDRQSAFASVDVSLIDGKESLGGREIGVVGGKGKESGT